MFGFHQYESDTNESFGGGYRGLFLDSSGTPISRESLLDGDTLTILHLGYVFIDDDGVTIDVTYNDPIVSFDEPSAPAAGDYWFDLNLNVWKRDDGVDFIQVGRIPVGLIVNDDSGCIGALSFDLSKVFNDLNDIQTRLSSTTVINAYKKTDNQISIYGTTIDYTNVQADLLYNPLDISWDMATDLDSGVSESSNTFYYFYLKEDGTSVISDVAPYDRPDLHGSYHPYEAWRHVDTYFNDSSSNLISLNPLSVSIDSLGELPPSNLFFDTENLPTGFIKGFSVTQIGNVFTQVAFNPGICRDFYDKRNIIMNDGLIKEVAQPFATGANGNGALDSSSLPDTEPNTLHAIVMSTDDGLVDIMFISDSQLITLIGSPYSILPSGFTYWQRICHLSNEISFIDNSFIHTVVYADSFIEHNNNMMTSVVPIDENEISISNGTSSVTLNRLPDPVIIDYSFSLKLNIEDSGGNATLTLTPNGSTHAIFEHKLVGATENIVTTPFLSLKDDKVLITVATGIDSGSRIEPEIVLNEYRTLNYRDFWYLNSK